MTSKDAAPGDEDFAALLAEYEREQPQKRRNAPRVGDTISGLRVDQINSSGIVLKYQKDSIELR